MTGWPQLESGGSRRRLLQQTSAGFGWLAFRGLNMRTAAAGQAVAAGDEAGGTAAGAQPAAAAGPLSPREPHFAARAKRVIFLFMQGGPSHVDTLDWKPELQKRDGQTGGSAGRVGKLLAPQFQFQRSGDSGLWLSELFPELAKHADRLCLLNGMHTSNAAHPQATIALHTGSVNFVRPSLGAWVTYGLGTVNQDLPGFVTISPVGLGGAQNYGSSFLPASFQGTRVQPEEGGIADIRNSRMSPSAQRRQIDFVQDLNRGLLSRHPGHAELEGLIQANELAWRMQSSVPDVLDLSGESKEIQDRYGLQDSATADFGKQCLMARRLAEAGVRFIQVSRNGWDQHRDLKSALQRNCEAIDRPIAALLSDLEQRGLLQDTLVLWGGEFGRSPQDQGSSGDGRRHNNTGYSMWMAGGGVRGGMQYGTTDELGEKAESGRLSTHDLHATILHLLGMDHTRLTYRYAGRDFRLTDVYGEVAKDILA
jgi:hypothetical protein